MDILDENTLQDNGALVTSAALLKLKKAASTATLLAVFIGLTTLFGIIINLSQIFSYFLGGYEGSLPAFYRWMNFYQLIINLCQVVVFIFLLQFIGKANKFTTINPPYSGEQSFSTLNSLFVWMTVNAVLILFSMILYRFGPLLGLVN